MHIGWVDMVLLGLCLLSALVGAWRGLVFELMSLAGWMVAYMAAHWFAPNLAPYIPIGTYGGALNLYSTFIALFLGVLIIWALLSRLLRMMIQATPLSVIDRALGALFGFSRGLLMAMVLFVVVGWTPWVRDDAFKQSQLWPWLAVARDALLPLLPADWSRFTRA